MFEKNLELRYASGRELAIDLPECRPPAHAVAFSVRARILTALILIAAVGSAGWLYYRNSRARWARNEALPRSGN